MICSSRWRPSRCRRRVPNLASAGVAANSASSSADLLTDLKSGYLLGANPRKQFIAQFIGAFIAMAATALGLMNL